jgi:3-oxoacyl-[acyl-carrier protein] reductase
VTAYVPLKPLHEWSQEEWDFVVGLNLTYVFRIVRAVIPAMIEAGGGAIVSIASTAGLTGSPRMAPYGAAKAGVVSLTRSLAAECGQYGIRVNAVAPGTVATALTTSDAAEAAAVKIPLKRRAVPADIANAVVFLASPEAAYVTGQTLIVDGGLTQRLQLPLPGADVSEAAE